MSGNNSTSSPLLFPDTVDDVESNISSTATSTHPAASTSVMSLQSCVVALAIIGAMEKGSVCFLLVQLERKKRGSTNLLIINQLCIDLFSCISALISFSTIQRTTNLTGVWGHIVCMFILNQMFFWMGLFGSATSIVMITFERFVKIVYPVTHKKYYRKILIYAAISVTWINGFIINVPVTVVSSNLVEGQCVYVTLLPSAAYVIVVNLFNCIWEIILPLMLLVYFYTRILLAILRSGKVHHGGAASSGADETNTRIQRNITKVLIIVAAVFVISWTPWEIIYALYGFGYFQETYDEFQEVWAAATCIALLHVCANPFIYATQYDVVKSRIEWLVDWLLLKKKQVVPVNINVWMSNSRV